MRCSRLLFAVVLLAFSTTAGATTITFNTDPFAGSTALVTPGRRDADLRILARLTNLVGQHGRDAMATFSDGNFELLALVPEPSGALLFTSAGVVWALCVALRR